MTIAAGFHFGLPGDDNSGVLLCADSRFSYPPSGMMTKGRKIFPAYHRHLNASMVIAFAGDANSCKKAIRIINKAVANISAEAYKANPGTMADAIQESIPKFL